MSLLAFAEGSIQLVPDGTLFVHLALILVMVYVLNRTFFKPINRILAEREARTKGRSSEAETILQQVEERLGSYEKSLQDARGEGYRMMEQLRAESLADRQQQVAALRTELNENLQAEKATIKTQIEESRGELKIEAQQIAEQIGARIMGRRLQG